MGVFVTMSTIDHLSGRLCQSLQEWRIRVLALVTELDRTHLEQLASDLRATLNRVEQELESRRTRQDRRRPRRMPEQITSPLMPLQEE